MANNYQPKREPAPHKTEKGTILPLIDLKGKDYLEVKWRIVWFREDHPKWGIETLVNMPSATSCIATAWIKDESGRVVAMAHKTEEKAHFPDFVEKAETGAIGRALALIGYGTQFCSDELDEGERIADAPVQRGPNAQALPTPRPAPLPAQSTGAPKLAPGQQAPGPQPGGVFAGANPPAPQGGPAPGMHLIQLSSKNEKGKRVDQISMDVAHNILAYWESREKNGDTLSGPLKLEVEALRAYWQPHFDKAWGANS